ncbi:MAG: reverse transcriptase/maturase family protein, partial [bacterium]
KLRRIHKASVVDRVLYQAVYQVLYRVLDPHFIHDSYASRDLKGTHRGVRRFEEFARKVSHNHRRQAFVLKCDVRKFFDSIDHDILLRLLRRKISDLNTLALLEKIAQSFETSSSKGLPLGNVTSQIFANLYLNELDQFVKHVLRARYYIRYCDDFVLLSETRGQLEEWVGEIDTFLREKLLISLHPNKVTIRKLTQGTDFLGYVSLPHHRVLRTKTKNRTLRKIAEMLGHSKAGEVATRKFQNSLASYHGLLRHCRSQKILAQIRELIEER